MHSMMTTDDSRLVGFIGFFCFCYSMQKGLSFFYQYEQVVATEKKTWFKWEYDGRSIF